MERAKQKEKDDGGAIWCSDGRREKERDGGVRRQAFCKNG